MEAVFAISGYTFFPGVDGFVSAQRVGVGLSKKKAPWEERRRHAKVAHITRTLRAFYEKPDRGGQRDREGQTQEQHKVSTGIIELIPAPMLIPAFAAMAAGSFSSR